MEKLTPEEFAERHDLDIKTLHREEFWHVYLEDLREIAEAEARAKQQKKQA